MNTPPELTGGGLRRSQSLSPDAEVGHYLNIGSSSVTRSIRKREQLIDTNVKVRELIEKTLKQ